MARVAAPIIESAWYVPDIEGNRADADPFRVRIRQLTAAEFGALRREALAGSSPGDDFVRRAEDIERMIIERAVLEVQGYSVALPGGSTLTPHTGADLYAAVMQAGASELPILADIAAAAQRASHLDEGALGKSAARSALPSAEIARSTNGAAPGADAGQQSSEPSATNGATSETATTSATLTSPGLGIPVYVGAHGAS
jgi:hypothetical protein